MEKTLRIEKMILEGDGLSRGGPDQRVAFVPYAVPGDKIKARLLDKKKNFERWIPIKVLEPSSGRVEPACPLFFRPGQKGDWCGGCDWQHLSDSASDEQKFLLVREAIERIGGVKNPPLSPLLSSPKRWGYRNKVQVPFRRAGRGGAAGFFAPGSHRVVPFDACPIQPDLSSRLIPFLSEFANQARWAPYDEDRRTGWLRNFFVRTNRKNQAMVCLVTNDGGFPGKKVFVEVLTKRFPEVVSIFQNVQPRKTNVILGSHWNKIWGQEKLSEEINGLTFRFSPGAFFQVNTDAAENLFRLAVKEGLLKKTDTLIDFYCGVGIFSLLGASSVGRVVGIEVVASAVRDAIENARLNRLSHVRFYEGVAEKFLTTQEGERAFSRPEDTVVFVDPPRAGLDERLRKVLLRLRPKRIVYVSCNPATFARDLKDLSSSYTLASATPVDLFPQTSHIELVARLEKR